MILGRPVLRQNVVMQTLHFRVASTASAALLLTVGLMTAGCSSSSSTPPTSPPSSPSSPSTSSSSPTTSSSSEPTSGTGAIAAIETNWAAFFNNKTPIPHRIALLQDGSQFSSVINGQAHSTLASAATSKVTKVTLTGTSQAAVMYDILVTGKVALPDQTGVAVYQDGVWKVGLVSFCGLLKLEAAGSTKGLPAGCKG
jgi:hypothetical protein